MPERSDCAALFERLSARMGDLAQLPRFSAEFADWHRDLVTAVEACFGSHSPELAAIRALQFEISSEVVESLLRTFADPEELDEQQKKLGSPLGAKVKEGMVNLSKQPAGWLEGVQQQHYQKMLNRASELLGEFRAAIRLRDACS
jgi:hypothetical protein